MRKFSVVSRILWGSLAAASIVSTANATPIAPNTVAGLVQWLRADAGVFNDAGVTPASNGNGVQQWNDQAAGAADNAAQSVSGNRPTYISSGFGINNKPYLNFNGTSNWLNNPLNLGGAKTVLIAYQLNATPGTGAFFSLLSIKDTGGSLFSETTFNNISGYQQIAFPDQFASPVNGVGLGITLNTNGHTLSHAYNNGGTSATSSYSAIFDNVSQSVATSGAAGRVTSDLGSIGGRVTSGLSLSAAFNGRIAEIIIYNTNLSPSDFAGVEDYLYEKYFVPIPEPDGLSLLLFGGSSLLAICSRQTRKALGVG